MKILTCPRNGPRPLQEFRYGGEFHEETDFNSLSDVEWADYVFNRKGEPGVLKEWWYHLASGTWFIAERDVVADRVVRTYLFDQKGDK